MLMDLSLIALIFLCIMLMFLSHAFSIQYYRQSGVHLRVIGFGYNSREIRGE